MNLKHAAYRTISKASRLFSNTEAPAGLRVLLYHSVGGVLKSDPLGTSITEKMFRSHIERYETLRSLFPEAPFGATETPAAAFAFDDGYRDTLTIAAPILAERKIPFIVFVTADHIDDASGLYLSKAELLELSGIPGATIGAHGDRHQALTGLDDTALKANLDRSRQRLQDWLGKPITTMSYPFGAVDRRVRDAAHSAGFTTAGCSLYGSNTLNRDPLLLKRTEIVAWDDSDDFESKLRGYWDWFSLRQGDPAS